MSELEQAIYNVIDNAHKFGGANGPVRIELECKDDRANLAITDNGPGIPADMRQHVFTRFFKGKRPGSKSGMGLGLFIAKGFIEAFSGTIAMQSPVASGSGSRVTIELPLVRNSDALAAA